MYCTVLYKHILHTLSKPFLHSFLPKHEQMVSTKLNAGGRVYSMAVDLALPNITQHNDLTCQLSRLYGRVGQRQNRTHSYG